MLITEHASLYSPRAPHPLPRLLEKLLMRLANRAQWCCPVSFTLADALRAKGLTQPQYQVVSNAVSTKYFYPDLSAKAPVPGLRFLHVSNFDPQAKNVAGLLRAFQQLLHAGVIARLTIAGDGNWDLINTLADELGLYAPTLTCCGPLTEGEVGELMRYHHVFILNSRYENQPCVVLEAQLCGMPVIATRVGDLPQLVASSQQGILIDPDSEDQLTQAMQDLIATFPQFDRAAIARAAKAQFASPVVQQAYEQVYAAIISRAAEP